MLHEQARCAGSAMPTLSHHLALLYDSNLQLVDVCPDAAEVYDVASCMISPCCCPRLPLRFFDHARCVPISPRFSAHAYRLLCVERVDRILCGVCEMICFGEKTRRCAPFSGSPSVISLRFLLARWPSVCAFRLALLRLQPQRRKGTVGIGEVYFP